MADVDEIIAQYRARMAYLREILERDGRIHAVSTRDPSYAILLTPNGSSPAPWRVTSFSGKTPVGHREYDRLDGGGPTQNALGEFVGQDWKLVSLPKRSRERRIKE